ncbi:uncharacterized protein scimp [Xiphophorus hellerii]|uniref:uncharacterized protein scimp n=1 Tax=Xiphophorus hellerii TaxID=8084 RepID=UPI0013B462E8|nr:uncharacterized protein LOC116728908 [Xiphophorus hellerii]XP_032433133.1 uncharacterized protein LOC116728908 [Xiphophorus hellerii]
MALLRKYIWVIVILGMVFVSLVISLIFVLINKCISRKAGKHRILQLQERPDFKIESNKYQLTQSGTDTPPLPPRTQFLIAEALSYENLAEECEHDDQSDHDYEEALDQMLDCVKVQDNLLYNHPNTNSGVSVTQSYENLAEENDYEESVDPLPDYVKVEDETEILPPPLCDLDPNMNCNGFLGQSYENLADENGYEESVDPLPDYVKVEDETEILPPPLCDLDPNMNCNGSLGQSYENLADENEYEESMEQQLDYAKVEDEFTPHQNDEARDNASTASTEDYDDIGGEDEEDYDDIG